MTYPRLSVAILAMIPVALEAHHSTALNYSQDEITLDGTIRSLRWINPHASFVLEVENEDGSVESWLVELLARIALERQGFDFDALQEGAEIELTARVGYRERTLRFGQAVLADGRVVTERNPLSERFTR